MSRERKALLWGVLLTVFFTLALMTGIIQAFASSEALWRAELSRFAPPERTGLAEGEERLMAAHIAEYLGGAKDSFQYRAAFPDGSVRNCFHEYELTHMADCRNLIRLDQIVFEICATGLVALGAGAAWVLRAGEGSREARGRALAGARGALWAESGAAAALILWACVNFDGLFVTFHKVAFSNDLWLLNPRTDLLIRLMPQELFVNLGLRGLAVFAVGMGLYTGIILWCLRRRT